MKAKFFTADEPLDLDELVGIYVCLNDYIEETLENLKDPPISNQEEIKQVQDSVNVLIGACQKIKRMLMKMGVKENMLEL